MILLFAFLAVFCLGLAPLFGKSALYNVTPATALVLRTFIASGLVSIWLIFQKSSVDIAGLSLHTWLFIGMESLLAAVLGELAYFYALQRGNVYEITVIMSCAPLVTIFIGGLFFDEPLSFKQLLGAIIVTTGLVILNSD